MALAKQFMGSSIMEKRPSFITSPSVLLNYKQNKLCMNPVVFPLLMKTRLQLVKAVTTDPLAAASVKSVPEKAVRFKVKAVVTVKNKHKEDLKDTIVKQFDAFTENIGRKVVLELLSTGIDPKTKGPKRSKEAVLKDWGNKLSVKGERVSYTAEFIIDSDFGGAGAITVKNKHKEELYVESITIEGFASGPVHFPCNSWVQSYKDHPTKRIFFSNQPYLPNQTPAGLKALREEEMKGLRGDGTGVRKLSDMLYDFDLYNDLGNPDRGIDLVRPILGGEKMPYPRRCRTGRPPTYWDSRSESRIEKPLPMYVPRDEQFEELKQNTFLAGRLKATLHNLLPSLMANMSSNNHDFKGFSHIDSLYNEGLLLKLGQGGLLKYNTPHITSKDKFAWLRDDEFARQAIAGVNPVSIERLQSFPPRSNLDPEIYGPQDSALEEEHIKGQINGMTIQQALEGNKLFIVDYHDIYLPFLDRINALDGRKAYATRTIFFLTPLGTLKPIAIELSLPPYGPASRSKRVVTPPVDATTNWTWQLAKSHVCSNDAGVHQLVNHWLRTHACVEPFILAAHRRLSVMHPIFKLLDPHMRYTLEINALARQSLISGDGVIESCFTPGRYCMEISAAAYKNFWRFDLEGLPADLIRRGMAVPDATEPHGLKLLIEDYPYASDGLLIWTAIENWIRTYVNRYYTDSTLISSDIELQAWYAESINVGHADLRHASWWPSLANADDLTSILTTLIWLASAQHASLNFGQYPYGGYVPNRPPLMRRLIPDENDPEYVSFVADPQKYFLSALPTLLQASKYMAVVDTLSTHSPDEEYIGERHQPSIWSGDGEMVDEFYRFSGEIERIEREIGRRNGDKGLRNRCGAGVLPYELLAPSSEPGVTCRGVPNSVSI